MANPIPYNHVSQHTSKNLQQQQALAMSLRKNDTTIVALTANEFLAYAVSVKESQGMNRSQITEWLGSVSGESVASVHHGWEQYKDSGKYLGSFLPVLSDGKKLALLAADLKRGGKVFSKYRVNVSGGQAYVVIAGYAGLRQHLTASRYLANNPKVVNLGIGKLGLADTIKGGIKVSVIFTVAFHALEQLMNDKMTWHSFVAGVTVDIVSAATGGGIAWAAISSVVTGAAMVAIGPMVAVVIVGAVLTIGLGYAAEQLGLENKLAQMLIDAEERARKNINQTRREFRKGLNYADEDPVGFMHRLFGVPYFDRFK